MDSNNKTGNERKTCPFEDEFNEEYGTRASTFPTFTISTLSHAANKTTRPTATITQPVATATRPTVTKPVATLTRPTVTKPVATLTRPTLTKPVATATRPTVTKPVTTLARPTFTKPVATLPRPTFTKPVATLTRPTVTKPVATLASTETKRQVDDVEIDDGDIRPLPKKQRPALRQKAAKPSVEWLQGYEERQTARQDARLDAVRTMHNENMTIMDRFLNIYKDKK